jgi:hypothetical protein
MTIMRQEVRIDVDGAAKAEKELKGVSAANDRIASSAKAASVGGLKSLEGALEHVTAPAGKALRVLNDVGDVFRLLGAGLAGGALFGGLQDIAESLNVMYVAAKKALDPTLWDTSVQVTKWMDAQAEATKKAADATLDLLAAQQAAGAGGMIKALEQLGGGADPAAVKRVMELTRNITDLEQQRLEVATQRARYESSGNAESLIRIQQQIEAARKELRGFTEVGANIEPSKRRSAVNAAPKDAAFSGASGVPGFRGMQSDAAFARSRYLEGAERNVKAMGEAAAYRERMLAGSQFGPDREAELPSFMSMLTADADEKAKFHADLAEASESTKAVFGEMGAAISDAGGMLTGFGKGMAHAAAATLLTGAGFKKAANHMLQGLAIQALGQALFEAAMGTASLGMAFLGHPGAGPAAAAHFQAAGMFGAIAAGAALGVGATGGFSKGGAGGGSSSAAAGTNPYQGTGGGSTQVVVMIGGEVVTRGVQVETRKQAQRGGISEPRMAMAS